MRGTNKLENLKKKQGCKLKFQLPFIVKSYHHIKEYKLYRKQTKMWGKKQTKVVQDLDRYSKSRISSQFSDSSFITLSGETSSHLSVLKDKKKRQSFQIKNSRFLVPEFKGSRFQTSRADPVQGQISRAFGPPLSSRAFKKRQWSSYNKTENTWDYIS